MVETEVCPNFFCPQFFVARQGLLEQDAEQAWLDLDPADDTDAMLDLLGSSVSYCIAVGPTNIKRR
ncbi:MAG: hypothetical protein ACI9JM_001464 [Halioglobus sp.]